MKILIAADVSGSISRNLILEKYVPFIHEKEKEFPDLVLAYFDHRLTVLPNLTLFEEELTSKGGGGTDITPVLQLHIHYDKIYILTDGYLNEEKYPSNVEKIIMEL